MRRVLDRVSFPTYTAAIPCMNTVQENAGDGAENCFTATRVAE